MTWSVPHPLGYPAIADMNTSIFCVAIFSDYFNAMTYTGGHQIHSSLYIDEFTMYYPSTVL
jgi:hypothetical protein